MSVITKHRCLTASVCLIILFCVLCAVNSVRKFASTAEGATGTNATIVLTFYYGTAELHQSELLSGKEFEKFPCDAEEKVPLADDELLMWRKGSTAGELVKFPFVATEDISFYAVIVKKSTLTIRADDGTEHILTYPKGQSPLVADFADKINDFPVLGYFADEKKTLPYDKTAPLEGDITVFASLKMTIEIFVDNIMQTLGYGSNLPNLPDTFTHCFMGYYSTEDDQLFEQKLTQDGVHVSIRYKRTHYQLTLVTEDGTSAPLISVDANVIRETDFDLPDGMFYRNEEKTEQVQFPLTVDTDLKIYFVRKIPDKPETIAYTTTVNCEEGEYLISGAIKYGEAVTFTVVNIEPARKVDTILVSCDGNSVVTIREGNAVTFRMPKGNIIITVRFMNEDEKPFKKKTPRLQTKEIVAIAVTGGILAVIGGVYLIKYLKKKKRR